MIPIAQTEAEVKKPIYETRAILDYNEWDQINDAGKQMGYRYKVAWKGHPDETWQTIQDLMSSGGSIEEYWADAKNGVKKWRKLRPASDNMAETLRNLTSEGAMRRQEISRAGVQLHQAIGKDHDQVYTRLGAGEIQRTDVFTVILDVAIRSELSKKEVKRMKEAENPEDTRKLYIPVRWTWNRLQKTCDGKQKKHIQKTMAEQASYRKHMCWMPKYTDSAGLGADAANESEIVVIPKMEMVACVKQVTSRRHAFRQEYIDKWAKEEFVLEKDTRVEDWIQAAMETKVDVYQAEGGDAVHHSIAGQSFTTK